MCEEVRESGSSGVGKVGKEVGGGREGGCRQNC